VLFEENVPSFSHQVPQKSLIYWHDSDRPSIGGNPYHLRKRLTTNVLVILAQNKRPHSTFNSVERAINKGESLSSTVMEKGWCVRPKIANINTVGIYPTFPERGNFGSASTTVIKNSFILAIAVITPREWPFSL
jgi:hypothetical protein